MFIPQSDYAINKLDKDAIVYTSTTGVHIRLTRSDFTRACLKNKSCTKGKRVV